MPFTVTQDQYLLLLNRVTALELRMNQALTALGNCISLTQVQELTVVLSTDNEVIKEMVTALEGRVTSLEEQPLD